VDNQSAFWSLHPYVYGKTLPAIPFSAATATEERQRYNGTAHRNGETATAERQRNGGLETRHKSIVKDGNLAIALLT